MLVNCLCCVNHYTLNLFVFSHMSVNVTTSGLPVRLNRKVKGFCTLFQGLVQDYKTDVEPINRGRNMLEFNFHLFHYSRF